MNQFTFEYSDRFFAKKSGSVQLNENSVKFILDSEEIPIQFEDIISYDVLYYQGVTLRLNRKNGNKFKLKALSSFCDPTQFGHFCEKLEESLTQYALNHNTGLVREPSIFEHKLMPWFLTSGTVIIIWLFVRNIRADYGITNLLVPAGIFLSLWVAFFASPVRRRLP